MTKSKEKFLRVSDSSVTEEARTRTHDVFVRGELKSVIFKHGEDTILPFEIGVKFMKDGFKVEEADGSQVTMPAVASDTVASQIGKDECVAKYTELSLTALKVRAMKEKDGEIYLDASEDDRIDIIEFLIDDPTVAIIEIDNPNEIEEIDLDADDEIEEPEVSEKEASQDDTQQSNLENDTNAPEQKEDGADISKNDEKEETFTLGEVKKATDEALVLIAENNLDINDIEGTGSKGNIKKADVEKYIADNASK